jgi:uncharacterized protein (TIGR02594 family)
MSILKKGSRNSSEVKALQLLLNAAVKPSPHLKPDGDFGQRTHDAVMRLQQVHRLAPDGVVGAQTWAALGQKPNPAPRPTPAPAVGAPWMDIATAELGVHENAAAGQHTKRIIEYHAATSLRATTDETPWCSSFVNWVMVQAGYRGTNNALARSWLEWGTALPTPRAGAVTVIKKKGASSDVATGSSTGFHVAFYVSSTSATLRLLGGNQGDQVKYSNFFLSGYDIRGYRWPS